MYLHQAIPPTIIANKLCVTRYRISNLLAGLGIRRSKKEAQNVFKKVGPENPRWGKTPFLLNGYPARHINGKMVYLHRLTMSEHLGRPLAREEVVHHKDGNRLNCSLDNLELTSKGQHSRHHNSQRIGPLNHFFGRSHSEATKKRISEIHKNRWKNPIVRKKNLVAVRMAGPKISANLRERWKDPVYRQHMSESISNAKRGVIRVHRVPIVCDRCCGTFYDVPRMLNKRRFCSRSCTIDTLFS